MTKCIVAMIEKSDGECADCRLRRPCDGLRRVAELYVEAYQTPKIDSADALAFIFMELGFATGLDQAYLVAHKHADAFWEREQEGLTANALAPLVATIIEKEFAAVG
jgi:hypothetical protein